MAKGKKYHAGFLHGLFVASKVSEIAYFSTLQAIKDGEIYKKEMGYERWEDFCNEEVGVSDETLRRKFSTLTELGPEMVKIASQLGLKWRDMRALESSLTETQKNNLKKGVLEIEGKTIQVNEDHKDDIQSAVDILIERAALAKKSEEVIKKKLDGIDKEHAKEVKAYQKQINDLTALVPQATEYPDNVMERIAAIEQKYNELEMAMRLFAFDKRLPDDPKLMADITGKIEAVKARVRDFSNDWDAFAFADEA